MTTTDNDDYTWPPFTKPDSEAYYFSNLNSKNSMTAEQLKDLKARVEALGRYL